MNFINNNKTSIASFELAKDDTEWRRIKERECRGMEHKRSGNHVDKINPLPCKLNPPSNQSQGLREKIPIFFTTLQEGYQMFMPVLEA